MKWIGISQSKYFDWKKRYGKVNEHNGSIPRDFWMEDWEKRAILDFHHANPLEGYRRLTFMMLDADVVAVSPSSVYVTPQTKLLGKEREVFANRDQKLEAARETRRLRRGQQAA